MKVVISGATGFLGKWLVNELINNAVDVTVLVRDVKTVPREWENKVVVVECSLVNFEAKIINNSPKKSVDIFFHFAWMGTSGFERSDIDLQLSNVQLTCAAIRLASQLGCKKFINAGSIMEYEAMQYLITDGSRPGLANIYSTAKIAADFMAKTLANNLDIHYNNVIISNIYGIGEKSYRFINTTLHKMIQNEKIALTHGNQLYDFIYVTDAVRAIYLVGLHGKKNESYYIGNINQRTLKEFILEMKQILKSNSYLDFGKIPYIGAMLTYKEFDTAKVNREFNFKPLVGFKDGIIKTRNWLLEGQK